jgi:hypothetical protein
MNFKDILKEQFKDLVTEETLSAVYEAFEEAVSQKAEQKAEQLTEEKLKEQETTLQEKINLEVEAALLKVDEDHTAKVEAIDKDHTAKLQKLIETIDEDHSNKLQKVLAKIDETHTEMLEQVINKYERELNESAEAFRGRIVEEVSNYLDLYLENIVPKDQISEAVENTQARKTLDQVRKLISIDESYVDNEIKEALVDGKNTIDSLKKELNEAVAMNTELNHKLNEVESNLLLEQKTQELPTSTRKYVTKLLKGKSPEYIQENFQYVVEMHEREISEKVENAKEASLPRRIVESTDRPEINENLSDEIVTEGNESNSSPVGEYLNVMKRGDKSLVFRN